MNTKLFFVILSCAMVVLTIVTICASPVINNNPAGISRNANCKGLADLYDEYKKNNKNSDDLTKKTKKRHKLNLDICRRENAMYGLEYASLISDIILGTLCCILGLLHYFEVGKYFEKVTGIIGLASGVIGFVLTIVYVGYSAYIFDNDYSQEGLLFDNGAYLHWEDGKYVNPWEDDAILENDYYNKAKYKDLGKKQYNYNSKIYKASINTNDNSEFKNCKNSGYLTLAIKYGTCEYIYKSSYPNYNDYKNKYIYDR